ncbi:MAG: aldolase/citrate lyase family protein [Armatimonadota bacterium]
MTSPHIFWTNENTNTAGPALKGAACITGSLKIAEMAGMLGFDMVWIEVEHGGASFSDVEDLCRAAEAGGAIPVVRVSNNGRENVLRALEAGGKMIVVPVVDTADEARELVQNGKFPPLGSRGFNTRSRGLGYGLDGIAKITETFRRANAETHLIAQIETREAVENLEAICAVEGISGVLVGPGDLSLAYDKPGAFNDPDLIATICDVMRRTRAAGKHAGILVAPGPLLTACREAGCDFYFCAGDINDLGRIWREVLAQVA